MNHSNNNSNPTELLECLTFALLLLLSVVSHFDAATLISTIHGLLNRLRFITPSLNNARHRQALGQSLCLFVEPCSRVIEECARRSSSSIVENRHHIPAATMISIIIISAQQLIWVKGVGGGGVAEVEDCSTNSGSKVECEAESFTLGKSETHTHTHK